MKSIHHIQASTPLCLLARTIVGLALTDLPGYAQSIYEPYIFTTIAGKAASPGSADGMNSVARFRLPHGVGVDSAGNLYVADAQNHTIRKMMRVGTNWVVTTIAGKANAVGSADGTNNAAKFNAPQSLAVDTAGNLYIAESGNHTLRKMTPVGTNWVVTTLAGLAGPPGIADGTNSAARFVYPVGVAVDSVGNLYVADFDAHTIRKVTPAGTNWVVTTIAGLSQDTNGDGIPDGGYADGTGSAARFRQPSGVTVDRVGNLYVADWGNNAIRKVTPVGTDWVVTTIAGEAGVPGSADGPGSDARFNGPSKLVVDSAGNIYVPEYLNNTIRKVTPVGTNWVVTTIVGKAGVSGRADGTGSVATINGPDSVAVDSAGNLYLSEIGNNTIRKGFPALMIASSGPIFGFKGGQFGFDLSGQAGNVVVVEGSTDLANWLPLWTNTLAGPLHFSDPQTGVHPTRLYRVHTK